MAKTQETQQLEDDIRAATLRMGVFGCLEVTIGFGGKERVDYMTYDTKGIFRCYEIKVSKSDFHSKHKHSFVGHYNYFVLTQELYNQVKEEIPDWVGVYVRDACVKKPKKQDIDTKEFSFRRSVNGKSTELVIPWTEMLKDSFIRSLYRDSQKLHRSKNKGFVDRTRNQIIHLKEQIQDYSQRFNHLYTNVVNLYGRNVTKLLADEEVHINYKGEIDKGELTNYESILLMNRRKLAIYLHSWQTEDWSINKIENMLKLTPDEWSKSQNTEEIQD